MDGACRGRGRGWYYKQKYGRGGAGTHFSIFGNNLWSTSPFIPGRVSAPVTLPLAHIMVHDAGRFSSQEGPDAQEEDRSTFTPESSAAAHARGTVADLSTALRRLEGSSYGAYHGIEGAWSFHSFTFILDRAQSDPYAAPSRCRVKVWL